MAVIHSCVVTDLAAPESVWFEWSASTLERLDQNNTMVINPIVYAECSVGFERIEEVDALFESLGFPIKPIPKEALFLAGKAFLQYKKRKGEKGNVLPDFFIGAHAAVSGYSLITRDRGRFSSYFPGVEFMPNITMFRNGDRFFRHPMLENHCCLFSRRANSVVFRASAKIVN